MLQSMGLQRVGHDQTELMIPILLNVNKNVLMVYIS